MANEENPAAGEGYLTTYQYCINLWSFKYIHFFTSIYPQHPITYQPWNWQLLRTEPSLTPQIIQHYNHLPWYSEAEKRQCYYENATLSQVVKKVNANKKVLYSALSRNDNVTIEFIAENVNKNWNWNVLTTNLIKRYELNQLLVLQDKLNWTVVSSKMRLTIDDIAQNRNLPWDIPALNSNPSFSFQDLHLLQQDILCNKESSTSSNNSRATNNDTVLADLPPVVEASIQWDCKSMSMRASLDTISNDSYYEWDWVTISKRNDLSLNFILYHLSKLSNTKCKTNLTTNSSITWEMVTSEPSLPINIEKYYWNPNCSLKVFVENMTKYWILTTYPEIKSTVEWQEYFVQMNFSACRLLTMYFMLYLKSYLTKEYCNDLSNNSLLVFLQNLDLMRLVGCYIDD